MRIAKLVLLILLLAGLSKSSRSQESDGVTFLSREGFGVVELLTNGFGNSVASAEMDAYKRVFEVVWFKGIPSSGLPVAMLKNEGKTLENHKEYFSNFFESGGYKNFVVNSTPTTLKLSRKRYSSKITLKINLDALKEDLKQNDVDSLNY